MPVHGPESTRHPAWAQRARPTIGRGGENPWYLLETDQERHRATIGYSAPYATKNKTLASLIKSVLNSWHYSWLKNIINERRSRLTRLAVEMLPHTELHDCILTHVHKNWHKGFHWSPSVTIHPSSFVLLQIKCLSHGSLAHCVWSTFKWEGKWFIWVTSIFGTQLWPQPFVWAVPIMLPFSERLSKFSE